MTLRIYVSETQLSKIKSWTKCIGKIDAEKDIEIISRNHFMDCIFWQSLLLKLFKQRRTSKSRFINSLKIGIRGKMAEKNRNAFLLAAFGLNVVLQ